LCYLNETLYVAYSRVFGRRSFNPINEIEDGSLYTFRCVHYTYHEEKCLEMLPQSVKQCFRHYSVEGPQ